MHPPGSPDRGLACASCGNPLDPGGLLFGVDASAGVRQRLGEEPYYSTRRTIARNVPVCSDCLASDDAVAFLLGLVSGDRAEGMGAYPRQCVVLCAHQSPRWWRRLRLRTALSWPGSQQARCPMCNRPARAWGQNAPRQDLALAEATVRTRDLTAAGRQRGQ